MMATQHEINKFAYEDGIAGEIREIFRRAEALYEAMGYHPEDVIETVQCIAHDRFEDWCMEHGVRIEHGEMLWQFILEGI